MVTRITILCKVSMLFWYLFLRMTHWQEGEARVSCRTVPAAAAMVAGVRGDLGHHMVQHKVRTKEVVVAQGQRHNLSVEYRNFGCLEQNDWLAEGQNQSPLPWLRVT